MVLFEQDQHQEDEIAGVEAAVEIPMLPAEEDRLHEKEKVEVAVVVIVEIP